MGAVFACMQGLRGGATEEERRKAVYYIVSCKYNRSIRRCRAYEEERRQAKLREVQNRATYPYGTDSV